MIKTKEKTIEWLKGFDELLGSGEHNNHDGIRSAIYHLENSIPMDAEVKVKLADILQILDDEEYTVSVHSNDTIDDKISESIANTAIIDFKKQLKQELLSKFSA